VSVFRANVSVRFQRGPRVGFASVSDRLLDIRRFGPANCLEVDRIGLLPDKSVSTGDHSIESANPYPTTVSKHPGVKATTVWHRATTERSRLDLAKYMLESKCPYEYLENGFWRMTVFGIE